MTTFKKVYNLMILENKDLFDKFKILHDNFNKNPSKFRSQFNLDGANLMIIIKKYQDILCGRSESTGFNKFTSKLIEKLNNEIKKEYPLIDEIGVEII